MKIKLSLLSLCLCFSFLINAACPPGKVEVTITVQTDDYGYEGYWEFVPSGNPCGTGTVFSAGNTLVGCNGGGQQHQNQGGYKNDTLYAEGPWCLTVGSSFDIIYIDDYGDGGFHFTINIDGYPVYTGLTGSGDAMGTRFTFVAQDPPATDAACNTIKNSVYIPFGSVNLSSWVTNRGTDTIHSINLNYRVDNGTIQSDAISGITIAPFDSSLLTHTTPWIFSASGSSVVDMWTSSPNGNTDAYAVNDTAHKSFVIGPPTPNVIDDYIGASPVLTVIGNSSDSIDVPRDLDFHPILTRYELWVVLKSTESIGGKTVKFNHAGQTGQTSLLQKDGNAWHFMSLPTAIAFSENENFATAPGVYDANHGSGNPFTGPTLWSSDSAIYAQPSGGNGSHIDMLHQSPYSMGICSEEENAFWVFDGDANEIVRYDFRKDHGPGNSDHSDGVIRRFTGINLACDPTHDVPSHVILDKSEGMLYIVDTDNHRIVKMNINSSTFLNNLTPYEALAEYTYWTADTWSVFADSALSKPCGIDLIGNRLIVSDYATGEIIIYDKSGISGTELGRISTGTPGIMGIKIGPDGKIWYVNALTNEVVRIDGLNTGISEKTFSAFSVFPNPASMNANIHFAESLKEESVFKVYDIKGSLVYSGNLAKGNKDFSVDVSRLPAGVYSIRISNSFASMVQKLVKK